MIATSIVRYAVPAACILLGVTGRARSQPAPSSETADQLFEEGRELARSSRWPEACLRFEASLRLDPALGTELNLASCLEHTGKLARAWALYHDAIDLAGKAGDPKRRSYAQTHAAALEPRLARFAITGPARPPAGLVVRWDGAPVASGALGVALFADAGRHELVAWAPGFSPFTTTVNLVEGQRETVWVPELASAPARSREPTRPSPGDQAAPDLALAPADPPAQPAPAPPPIAPSRMRTYVVLGLAATGVATVTVGLVFGARARSSLDDARSLCGDELTCSDADFARGEKLIDQTRSRAAASTALVTAGSAAIIAGAIVYLTRPTARERPAVGVVPVAHDRGAGIALAGRF